MIFFSEKKLTQILLILTLIFNPFNSSAHSDGHNHNFKKWYFHDSNDIIKGQFIYIENGIVSILQIDNNISRNPLESFICNDQSFILQKSSIVADLNNLNSKIIESKKVSIIKIKKSKAWISIFLLITLFISFLTFFLFLSYKKFSITIGVTTLTLLIIIACSSNDETMEVPQNNIVTNNLTSSTSSSTSESNSSTSTSSNTSANSTSTSNNDQNNSVENPIDIITNYFSEFPDVTITSDENYFYVNSYSWPNHEMGIGITSWQEQVPIPQNYTGDNSWRIPINPMMSDNPIDTSINLFRGAIAIAINGIPSL